MACLADADVADRLNLADRLEEKRFLRRLEEALEANYRPQIGWAELAVDEQTEANVVCCLAGRGEGMYRSYYALDAEGGLSGVLLDFALLAPDQADQPPPPPVPAGKSLWPWRRRGKSQGNP